MGELARSLLMFFFFFFLTMTNFQRPTETYPQGNPGGEFPNRTDSTLTTSANGLTTTTTERCICGKVCKNARGLKKASEEEKPPLAELRNIIRKKLMTLRRAECHRRRSRERARKQTAFIADPFGFTKQLLGQKRSGRLACSKEELDHFLHNNLSDPDREQEL